MLKVKFGQIFLATLLVISSVPNFARAGEARELNLAALGALVGVLRAFSITPDILNFYRRGAATAEDSESLVEYVTLLRGLSEQDEVELAFNLFQDSNQESDSDDDWEDLGAPEGLAAPAAAAPQAVARFLLEDPLSIENPEAMPVQPVRSVTPEQPIQEQEIAVTVAQSGSLFFSENGTFIPPPGVRQIQVIAIGGGAGGGAGGTAHRGGGGSGYLVVTTVDLRDGAPIAITVGTGGSGGTGLDSREGHAGGDTLFGDYVRAPGGGAPGQSTLSGGDGGSGGGAGGGSTHALPGGDGGRRGSNGQQLSDWAGGTGMSSSAYAQLDPAVATDGPGGLGGRASRSGHPGGGGGGGLIVHGQQTPTASAGVFNDSNNFGNSGYGGSGYGAGGGGGGLDWDGSPRFVYHAGGKGAPGALLIRW